MSADEWIDIRVRLRGGPQFQAQATAVKKSVQGMGQSVERAGTAMEHTTRRAWAMNQALFTVRRVVYAGTLTIGVMAAALIRLGFQFDKMRQVSLISFTILLHSSEKARKELGYLFKLAAYTPFEFQNVQEAARQFLGWGFSVQQTNRYLQIFSDVISGIGGDVSILDRVTLAFGQIRSAGRLMGQDLRQLQQAIPGISEILRTKLNLPPGALSHIGTYNIDANTAIEAIMATLQQRFHGAAAALSRSVQGRLSTAHDLLSQLMGQIELAPFRRGSAALGRFNDALLKLNATMQKQGFTAMVKQMDSMLGLGGRLTVAWVILLNIGLIWFRSVFRAFRDVGQVVGTVLVPPLMVLAWILSQLAAHSTLLRIVVTALIARYIVLTSIALYNAAAWRAVVFWKYRAIIASKLMAFWGLKEVTVEKLKYMWTVRNIRSLKGYIFAMKRSTTGTGTGYVFTGKFAASLRKLYSVVMWRAIPAIAAWSAAIWANTVAVWANNAAWYANPIVWVIAAVLLLTVGLTVLYFKWKKFHDFVNANWRWLALLGGPIVGPVVLAITVIEKLYGWIKKLLEIATHPIRFVIQIKMPSAGGIFKKLLNLTRRATNPLENIIPQMRYTSPLYWEQRAVGLQGGARGGTITRAGQILVGERGPEVVSLPQAARITPLPPLAAAGVGNFSFSFVNEVELNVDGRKLTESVSRYPEILAQSVARARQDRQARR